MTLFIMVWKVMNTLIISIWNVDNREFVQFCPALVWKVPNVIILEPIMMLFIMVWKLHLDPYHDISLTRH